MSLSTTAKLLAGAVAIAISGAALANTTLDGTTTGDLFLNVVDTTNSTSFLFDTGISQASFSSTGNYSFNLASDPNFQAFMTAAGSSDVLDYSVLSATNTGPTTPNRDTVFTTGTVTPPANSVAHANQSQAQTIISQFAGLANIVTSTTSNSAVLGPNATTGTNLYWGAPGVEGAVSQQLLNVSSTPYADSTALGTAMAFYGENGNGNLTTFASDWDLTKGGALTYGTPVPLPTPVLLLLSGLACMSVVARRKRSA